MIWLWICAAWVISFAVLKNRRVQWEHLIWFLLPVDMYGITIAGVTIKTYMLFGLIMVLRHVMQKRRGLPIRSRWSLIMGVLAVLMVLVNMVNNNSTSSVTAILLFPLVWFFSVIYVASIDERAYEDIPNILVAAGIGFGVVFSIACILFEFRMDWPGVIARRRQQDGMVMLFFNMKDGSFIWTQRLRGFSIDPNTMGCTFFLSAIVAVLRIMSRKAGWREYLALILGGNCVYQSNSRMGMICFALVVLIGIAVGYRNADARVRNIVKAGTLIIPLVLIVLFVTGYFTPIVESFLAQFDNRSGLNDEYGRLTIWQEAISVLFRENPLLGVGFGQMQFLTEMGRASHNTWLEFFAAGGILVGGLIVIMFLVLIYEGFLAALDNKDIRKQEYVWTMFMGLLVVMISLFGVDHLMYSYLWFTAALVAAEASKSRRKI